MTLANPKPWTGRPRKLDDEKRARILEALTTGSPRVFAARLVGISEDTFARELKRSADFAAAVERAEAEAVVRNLSVIQQAATDEGQWTAAAWTLERRYPQHFGRRLDVAAEVSTQTTHTLTIDTTPSELAAAVSMAMAAQGAGEMPAGTVIDVPKLETRTVVTEPDQAAEPVPTVVNGRRRYVEPPHKHGDER